jgi:HK97 family phage prohead protease
MIQFKNSGRVKDIDEKNNIVKMVWSATNIIDSDGDLIASGAFKKTIQERGIGSAHPRIKHFKNHDITQSPGMLQELYEEGNQLIAVSKLVDTTLGRDTLIEYKEGIITEHSIGFEIPNGKFEMLEDYFLIKEVILWEGSSLTGWGANMFTPTLEKALQKDELIKQLAKVEKALSIRNFSDEKYINLNVEYKKLLNLVKSLVPSKSHEPTNAELLTAFKKGLNK